MDSDVAPSGEKNEISDNNNNNDNLEGQVEKENDSTTELKTPKENGVPKTKPRQKRRILRGDIKRESTPIRFLGDENGEDKVGGVNGLNGREKSSSSTTSETPSRQGSFRHVKKNSIELAQQELITMFNKTKKTLSTAAQMGRERFRKYEQQLAKRSQSAPDNKFVDELRESLKRIKPREYSLERNGVKMEKEEIIPHPPSSRQRRRPTNYRRATTVTPKIIEVLDPKTQKVVQRKSIGTKSRRLYGLQTRSLKDLYKNYQIHKKQFPHDYLLLKTTFHKCCCELFLIIVLCGFGGIMFKYVEGSFESFYKCGVKRVKRDFVDLLWTKSHNLREDDWKSLARSRLRQFEEELHSAHEAGMTDYSGMRSWSFLNGIVYCLTIVTTIGYGHMYPKTTTGRALSIVYALIGIPLFLIALTDFGKLFTRGIKFVWSFVRRLYYTGSCRKVRKDGIFRNAQNLYDYATHKRPSFFDPTTPGGPDQDHSPTTPAISNFEIDDEFNLPISVALFILVSYIFCGACLYMVFEKWNFFESFYFVFISMSTIGFGDYVPRDPAFMIGSIVYLVFGLALMSMCINVVQAKLSDTFKQASAKIGATIGFQVDEEGSVITAPVEEDVVGATRVENVDETAVEGKM